MKIYLDNCCFNRPFDEQNSLSIFLETQAKLMIQKFVNEDMLTLIWSFILDYENSANPDENIKENIFKWRTIASKIINFENDILIYAKKLIKSGLGKKDALHIACAHKANADFFITVDKKIIRKSKLISNIKVLNPIDFIHILEERNEN